METNAKVITWSHHNPVNILFGPGVLNEMPMPTPPGEVLLVTSPGFTRRGVTAQMQERLKEAIVTVYDEVTPNPDIDDLDDAAWRLRDRAYTTIIALGGGSVIDSAKALRAAFTSSHRTPLAAGLRENPGQDWSAGVPLIAIPTTAGTGSEVTPFATVWDRALGKKYSLAGSAIYPDFAVLDPECTLTLPASETLHSGLDAISHAMESLWNRHRTPISTQWAIEALRLATAALPILLEQPGDLVQRARMQEAALLAGLAISQTRTAVAHAISYPLTLRHGIPHGLACSFTLVAIYRHCVSAGIDLAVPTSLLQDVCDCLTALAPGEHVLKYATAEAIHAVSAEMMNPGRADNFILPINEDLIHRLLNEALSSEKCSF